MSQVSSPSSEPGPSGQRTARRRQEGSTNQRFSKAIPPLLAARQEKPSPPPPPAAAPKRFTLLPFSLGLALGIGIAGPLPRQIGPLLAGLIHAPNGLAAIIEPLGIGERRILVMGSDVVGGNTDVMFTVQIKGGTTRIVQVPRDTYVESKQLGILKANALYGMVGPQAATAEVGKLISAPVERHLKVNLDAVAKLADTLGGVEVDVPQRMYYVDNAQGLYIDLYPGQQLLKGKELEGFLRFRHDALGDLGRMDRQKLVINQVFKKLVEPSTVARLPALIKIAGEDIRTDLSPIEITQLLTAMARTKLSTERLPGRLYWHDDHSYWMPNGNVEHSESHSEAEQARSAI